MLSGELQEGFKKREFIDLHHADITLDIICLTLPKEEDIEDIIAEHNEDTHPSTSNTTLSSHINAAHEGKIWCSLCSVGICLFRR